VAPRGVGWRRGRYQAELRDRQRAGAFGVSPQAAADRPSVFLETWRPVAVVESVQLLELLDVGERWSRRTPRLAGSGTPRRCVSGCRTRVEGMGTRWPKRSRPLRIHHRQHDCAATSRSLAPRAEVWPHEPKFGVTSRSLAPRAEVWRGLGGNTWFTLMSCKLEPDPAPALRDPRRIVEVIRDPWGPVQRVLPCLPL
jgi:hypothetical protein